MPVATAQSEPQEDQAVHKDQPQQPQYTMQGVSQPGRLRDVGTSSGDRNYALAIHLSLLATLVIGPLAVLAPPILWIIRRHDSPFIDDHGREMVNVMITGVLVCLLVLTGIGAIFTVFWLIVFVINMIRAAVASSNGEFFRYPMTMRFIN